MTSLEGWIMDSIMNGFDHYQEATNETAIYPSHSRINYPILGLAGEVGELCNKYKKVIRDGADITVDDAVGELGDILWYLARVAADMGISLGYVAEQNLAKLQDRKERGVLGGSGDKR
jgi:NTP pyrophosphatase (non-canonical NTP hydrolase)